MDPLLHFFGEGYRLYLLRRGSPERQHPSKPTASRQPGRCLVIASQSLSSTADLAAAFWQRLQQFSIYSA